MRIISAIIFAGSMIGMVGGILLHSGRGGGLSDMLGGAGSGAGMGSTSAERNLTRITTVCAVVWIFSVVALGMLID
jgi:preprotein translocase subunit SecG